MGMKLIFFLMIMVCMHCKVYADGPPDLTTTPHLTIILSNQQVTQLARSHRVRLSDAQSTIVKRLHPKFKGVIEVVTLFYNDCCCGMDNYAIWSAYNTIALPVEGSWGEYDDWLKDTTCDEEALFIGMNGKIWKNQKELTETALKNLCAKTLREHQKEKGTSRLPYLWIYRPPALNAEAEKNLNQRIARLQGFCLKQGVDLVGYGVGDPSEGEGR